MMLLLLLLFPSTIDGQTARQTEISRTKDATTQRADPQKAGSL